MKTGNKTILEQTNISTSHIAQDSRGEKSMTRMIIQNGITRSLGASLMVLALVAGTPNTANAVSPATIDNTATVTGNDPGGNPITPVDSNDVEVDLEDPDNELTITKSGSITTDSDTDLEGDAGDVITYSYTVTNSGNTTLTAVGVTDTHEGSGTFSTPTFSSWTNQAGSPAASGTSITMAPGAVAVFTTTYTITATDINTLGGTGSIDGGRDNDGNLDNSAVATGSFGATSVPSTDSNIVAIALDADASLAVAKAAYEAGVPVDIATTGLGGATVAGTEQPVNTTITYVYTVTNDGDVPISTVGLSDVHSGLGTLGTITYNSLTNTSGNSVYTTGNTVDTLYPGDIAYFTATYTITQADIDAQ